MPPLGIFFGWLLLGEHLSLPDMIGIVPVALGIYLVTRPARVRKDGLIISRRRAVAAR